MQSSLSEKLEIARNAVGSTMAGMAVYLVRKACHALTKSFWLVSLQVVIKPNLRFSSEVIQFQIFKLNRLTFLKSGYIMEVYNRTVRVVHIENGLIREPF